MSAYQIVSFRILLRVIALLCAAFFFPAVHANGPSREFALRAESPEFWKLISHDAKLETLATGFGFTEGPVWDPKGFVYVSDEELNKIFRVYPDGHKEELLSLGDPDGNTYDRDQKLLDCASVLRAIIRIEPDRQVSDSRRPLRRQALQQPERCRPRS